MNWGAILCTSSTKLLCSLFAQKPVYIAIQKQANYIKGNVIMILIPI